jgi:bifunctional non-homologous end joining protein LigD
MLARPADIPRGAGWAFEVKWDGFRAVLDTRSESFKLWSRRGWNMTERAAELADFPARGVFDGELVAFDEETRPSWPMLCDRVLHRRSETPVMFVVFDVLELDGQPTGGLPYVERRRILEDAKLIGPAWFTPDAFDDGPGLFAAVVKAELEGVVAKKLTDPYKPGERGWVKTKNRGYWRFDQERRAYR